MLQILFPLVMPLLHQVQLSVSVHQLLELEPNDDCLTVEKLLRRRAAAAVAAPPVMVAVRQCRFPWCWLLTKLVAR